MAADVTVVPGAAPFRGERAGFDHREPGTPEQAWLASGMLEKVAPLSLAGLQRLSVIAAHPDDETLGAGGLIARAAAAGVEVSVLVATAGEASHPHSPTHGAVDLAALRRAEVRNAVHRLAPGARLVQLDLGDGALARSQGRLAAAIRELVRAGSGVGDPAGTWIVAPWRADRHPDHAAVANAAAEVAAGAGCRLLEYPVWAWHWATPGDGTLHPKNLLAVDLPPQTRRAKAEALAAHRSQVEPLSAAPGDEPVVPPGFRDHFLREREVFVSDSSLDREFFDDFYTGDADPWGFRTRWYERRKRAITLASLPRERFVSAFEPGCAIGVLTAELAPRCETLLATDICEAPLAEARERLAGIPGVHLQLRRVPQDWPPGLFDLIVLSEIGYYCGSSDLSALIDAAASSLTADGVLVACHWRHPVAGYPMTGDEVHRRLRAGSGLTVLAGHVEEDFLLDVLVRPPARSVARCDGLVS